MRFYFPSSISLPGFPAIFFPAANDLLIKWENGDITKFALFDISQTLPNPVTTNGGLKLTVDDLLLQADTFEREHLKYGPTP